MARRLQAGDLVWVSRGALHSLRDSLDSTTEPYEVALDAMGRRLRHWRAEGNRAQVFCAAFEFSNFPGHPLLSLVPEIIHIRGSQIESSPQLKTTLALLMAEATDQGLGSGFAVSRIMDALLVFVLRAWLSCGAEKDARLLSIQDPIVGRAIRIIHRDPAYPWRIHNLAKEAATSRPTLVRRFSTVLGMGPAAYLSQWRLNLAAIMLRETEYGLEAIAERSGYGSAAALSKAFRRAFGLAPGRFRQRSFQIGN